MSVNVVPDTSFATTFSLILKRYVPPAPPSVALRPLSSPNNLSFGKELVRPKTTNFASLSAPPAPAEGAEMITWPAASEPESIVILSPALR